MTAFISSINYCPVKSVSFQSLDSCEVKKNVGIIGDRIFAFTKNLDFKKARQFEKSPHERKGKWNNLLTLKNCPVLNKYNFLYQENKLTLMRKKSKILSVNIDSSNECELLSKKILELENTIKKPIFLIKNDKYPFFDTSVDNKDGFPNSISIVNVNSIKDFKIKIRSKIENSRFRGNIYVDGLKAWEERNWIGKVIKINNILFKVEKNIPRCIAVNLKPNSNDNSLNLLKSLKKNYNHFDMGVYITALGNGKIKIGDIIN